MGFFCCFFSQIEELFNLVIEICNLSLKISMMSLNLSFYCMGICLLLMIVCLLLLKLVCLFSPSGEQGKLHIGFFHPYCNAGGGGERVLWAAIRSIQARYPNAECHVYTGDVDATAEQILINMKKKFNVELIRPPHFIFLKFRKAVEAKYYPYFTLLGQSLGSIVLGAEALGNFRPQIFIDTMGYAFTYPLFRFMGNCTVGCYTHYPTISTDMLTRVSNRTSAHNNREFIARSSMLSHLKLFYYNAFAFLYGMVGKCSHVVMVNSSWTEEHIKTIWKCQDRIHTVFPPCNTEHFSSLPLIPDSEKKIKYIISIGQFRPEKDHPLQLKSFKTLLDLLENPMKETVKLVLIGGVRDEEDEQRVEDLKSLAKSLEIEDHQIQWFINAPFDQLLQQVQLGTVGIHSMWNEHFGIGIVECMAGGLIMVANDSGGPKLDILKPIQEHQCLGFLASDENSYAQKIKHILLLSDEERFKIRNDAREFVVKFSDEMFCENFLAAVAPLLDPRKID